MDDTAIDLVFTGGALRIPRNARGKCTREVPRHPSALTLIIYKNAAYFRHFMKTIGVVLRKVGSMERLTILFFPRMLLKIPTSGGGQQNGLKALQMIFRGIFLSALWDRMIRSIHQVSTATATETWTCRERFKIP